MRTNAPKMMTWYVAAVLGLLGILGGYAGVVSLSAYALHLMTLAFVLLALATVMKGL